MSTDLPIRDELRGQTAYGAPQLEVPVRLNTNENPFAPSQAVVDSITARVAAAASSLNRYPDREARELRAGLAGYVLRCTGHAVSPGQVWPANGSNEVLQQLLQVFGGPGRVALGFEPSYSMHRLIARGTGTEYRAAARDDRFEITAAGAAEAIVEQTPDVVFLCSPNNPTGTALDLDVVRAAYDATDGVVVVDEAYGEFSNRPSAVTLLPGRERLIVVRTLSKALQLAGARIGYAVAAAEVVEAIELVRLPYHLSAVTQAVGCAAVEHADELLQGVEALKEQRDRLCAELAELGYDVLPSDANFVFFGGVDDASATWQRLVADGVLIRDVGIPGYLRVTAGTPQETEAFLKAIRTITEEPVA